MNIKRNELGMFLQHIRGTKKESQRDMAIKLKMSHPNLLNIETSKRRPPLYFDERIIKAYKLTDQMAEEVSRIVENVTSRWKKHNPNPKVFVSAPFKQFWTKEYLGLCAKVVNLLPEEEALHQMKKMLYIIGSNHSGCFETASIEEMKEQFREVQKNENEWLKH